MHVSRWNPKLLGVPGMYAVWCAAKCPFWGALWPSVIVQWPEVGHAQMFSCYPSHCWEAVTVDSLPTSSHTLPLDVMALYCPGSLCVFVSRQPRSWKRPVNFPCVTLSLQMTGEGEGCLRWIGTLLQNKFHLVVLLSAAVTRLSLCSCLGWFLFFINIHISCVAYSTYQISRLYYDYYFYHPTLSTVNMKYIG